MSDKHTQGLLQLDEGYRRIAKADDGRDIFLVHDHGNAEANARRLVACWNACLGMSTAGVETVANLGGIENKLRVTSELVRRRDELLEALKKINGMCAAPPDFSDATIQEVARAAIAKAEASK